jgi:hypothetical protein
MSMYQLPFELIRVIFKLNEEFWILSSNSIISLKSIHAIPKPRKYTDRVTLTIYLPRRRYEKYTFYYMFYYMYCRVVKNIITHYMFYYQQRA